MSLRSPFGTNHVARPPASISTLRAWKGTFACVAVALMHLYGCSGEIVGPPETQLVSLALASATTSTFAVPVSDLRVTGRTDSSVTVGWSQVDDGEGNPARYRVKYDTTPIDWGDALVGCDLVGTEIGAWASCTIRNLDPNTSYDLQMMSYRTEGGAWLGAAYSNVAYATTSGAVGDLSVSNATDGTLTVRWRQVDDGTGAPAWYRVKWAEGSMGNWGTASVGCSRTQKGTVVGRNMSCVIGSLSAATSYEVQLVSYRIEDGAWVNSRYSNVAEGTTAAQGAAPGRAPAIGIWVDQEDLDALPTSGAAWDNLREEAWGWCGNVDLADMAQSSNVCILAKALVYARTGRADYRYDVIGALKQIAKGGTYSGTALSLGRELAAYVIAADLIDLPSVDPWLEGVFRTKIRELLSTYTSGASANLVDCHEHRPNNWGAMCGGSRAAVAAYLGDTAELARVALVFEGFLGNRSAYADFSFGQLSWQCDPDQPVAINRASCERYGQDLDGVIPDDQRRGGWFSWPPPKENYTWEAMQGILVQAVILERAGYPAFEWGDQAILRAAQWLYDSADFPADGDDSWMPQILNYYYGATFPAPVPARPGKNMGWSDWTHGD